MKDGKTLGWPNPLNTKFMMDHLKSKSTFRVLLHLKRIYICRIAENQMLLAFPASPIPAYITHFLAQED